MAKGERWTKGSARRSYKGNRFAARRIGAIAVVVAVVLLIFVAVQLLRGVPQPTFGQSVPASSKLGGPPWSVAWPTQGEAAAEILGVGKLGTYGGDQPEQIASVAKMMTALVIMHDHPLSIGQSGPTITITPQYYQIYVNDKAANDSVMAVAPGESLTEYQMLEGLLIPSADNLATVLADWDAGSVKAFVAKMNAYAKRWGLTNTHYGDPSGLTPSTLSIPSDQLILAHKFMENPVLAQIASMPQATLPVAGTVYNVDYVLGHDNIVGIKTGSILTGNFAMATQIALGSRTIYGLGVILGQGGQQPLITALDAGKAMARSLAKIPRYYTLIKNGQLLGYLNVPGRGEVAVYSGEAIRAIGWRGLSENAVSKVDAKLYGKASGSVIGHLQLTVGEQHFSVPLVTASAIKEPSILWRLAHF
jgi:D-alanyl-D-alanine carboxypeptidase (penicillin-binding protein 5/6)